MLQEHIDCKSGDTQTENSVILGSEKSLSIDNLDANKSPIASITKSNHSSVFVMKFIHKDGTIEYLDIAGNDEEPDEFDYQLAAAFDAECENERKLGLNPRKSVAWEEIKREFGLDR